MKIMYFLIHEKYKRSMNLLYKNVFHGNFTGMLKGNVPCIDSQGANTWLNRKDVQQALHVQLPSTARNWRICSDILVYNYKYETLKPVYDQLFNTYKLPALNYNGDTDMACNFLGNQWFVDSFNRPITKEWEAWSLPKSDQISGFRQYYDLINR
eukprot:UN03476